MSTKKQKNLWLVNWRKTPKGLLTNIYSNQKRQFLRIDSKRNKHSVHYSVKQLHDKFLNDKKYLKIYKEWVESGYKSYLKPSIDRINSFKNYTINNIQVLTWEQNRKKGHIEVGIKSRKKVSMYSMDGKKIKTFHSLVQAKKIMKLKGNHISAVCRGKLKSYKGYLWKYQK